MSLRAKKYCPGYQFAQRVQHVVLAWHCAHGDGERTPGRRCDGVGLGAPARARGGGDGGDTRKGGNHAS